VLPHPLAPPRFTFSEFLEGLVFCALERPTPDGLTRPAEGLTKDFIFQSVKALLEQNIFAHAKSSKTLETRRM
jgi:hypothetical protein